MTKRLLLIDGHSMAYRAFFALPAENFTTAQGQHTNAIYGFATMLLSLLTTEKPTHVAVAFDVSRKTFRSEIFPEYKANRAKTPDEFRSQMSYLHELVTAFGITTFEVEGFEADDIIATIAKQAERENAEVFICTGDRDSFQLVNEKTTVLYPKRGVSDLARMTPAAVQEKYGMSPEQYPDFAALRGDPSDNLPSVPGVGEKTAAKWVVEYGSLHELIANIDKLGGKVGQSLRDSINDVIRNRELTQLVANVPLELSIDSLAWSGVDENKTNPLFEKLEFKTLKDRMKPILLKGTTRTVAPEFELFAVEIVEGVLTPEEASTKIARHSGDIAIAYQLVEEKLHRYAVALTSDDVFLVHGSTMGDWATNKQVGKIAHDAKSLARINGLTGVCFDTSLAAYLVNPGVRSQELKDIQERWGDGSAINETSPEQELLTSARALFALRDSLTRELKERNLFELFTTMELPVADLLGRMESVGIAVDRKGLDALAASFEGEVKRETKAAHDSVGHEFNVASPKQLQVVLFDELNLPKTKKIKTGYTTDAEALQSLFAKTEDPVLECILRWRDWSRLRQTVDGLIPLAERDGRIHTTFQQTVAATGRLSSTEPNLQNIPIRTEAGRRIRECFVVGEGFSSLLTADYSQIEMRIMAHLSEDEGLIDAFAEGEDLHTTVAARVFGVSPSDVDAEMRRRIKAMSYGLAYGLSAFGLAQQLGIEPDEARVLRDDYFARFGGVQDYLRGVVDEARQCGYTETLLGRRRYLPDLASDNRQRREMAERMALNAPIQGSAADIIKVAMLEVERALLERRLRSRLLLQVHDELVLEVAPGESAEVRDLVVTAMAGAVDLRVPLDVSVGEGANWETAGH